MPIKFEKLGFKLNKIGSYGVGNNETMIWLCTSINRKSLFDQLATVSSSVHLFKKVEVTELHCTTV